MTSLEGKRHAGLAGGDAYSRLHPPPTPACQSQKAGAGVRTHWWTGQKVKAPDAFRPRASSDSKSDVLASKLRGRCATTHWAAMALLTNHPGRGPSNCTRNRVNGTSHGQLQIVDRSGPLDRNQQWLSQNMRHYTVGGTTKQ